jgi:hypothetical protein
VTEAVEDFAADRLAPGTTRVHGLASPDCVRLVVAPALQAAHGATLAVWEERLRAGEVMPADHYDGPELTLP